jgi:hypothetical protein
MTKYSWIKWKTFPFIGLDFSLATDEEMSDCV